MSFEKFLSVSKILVESGEELTINAGFTIRNRHDFSRIVLLLGHTSHDYLPGSNCHIVKIGPHISVWCDFNPISLLRTDVEYNKVCDDPIAAISLAYGILGFDYFRHGFPKANAYFMKSERAAVALAKSLDAGEVTVQVKDKISWASTFEGTCCIFHDGLKS